MGLVISVTPRPLFTPGKDLVPTGREAGWAPGPVWTGAENLATTGIRSPDRPACSQSVYRLSYRAHSVGVLVCVCVCVQYLHKMRTRRIAVTIFLKELVKQLRRYMHVGAYTFFNLYTQSV